MWLKPMRRRSSHHQASVVREHEHGVVNVTSHITRPKSVVVEVKQYYLATSSLLISPMPQMYLKHHDVKPRVTLQMRFSLPAWSSAGARTGAC